MATRKADNRIHYRWPDAQRDRLIALLMQGNERLEELFGNERISRKLFAPGKLHAVETGFTRENRCYYDTFDWRLYKNDLVLLVNQAGILLRNAETGETLVSSEFGSEEIGTIGQASLGLAQELPRGPLRDRVSALTGIRSLLRLACTQSIMRRYRILNDDEKTVVEFALRELSLELPSGPPVTMLDAMVYPIRGYTDEQQALTKALIHQGFVEHPVPMDFAWILDETGQTPGAYSAKPSYPIASEMRSDEATKAILRPLHDVMRANEAGILADLDTEFLHDYRTSIRRTRSALSQIKHVFPKETTKAYGQAFAGLGDLTNELRDLDVYLLERKRYRKMLPKHLRSDIEPLFEYLAAKRTGALAAVTVGLQSEEYQQLMQDWSAFLMEAVPESPTATNAKRQISELARARLLKRYRKLLSEGNRILEESDDKLLHALRIDTKKLRYLLEFFAAVLPQKESKALIKQMKRLQENLGTFNDLSVQQAYLLQVAEELPLEDPRMRGTLVAIGSLVERLGAEQVSVREEFADIFSKFASPANQRTFASLLNGDTQ